MIAIVAHHAAGSKRGFAGHTSGRALPRPFAPLRRVRGFAPSTNPRTASDLAVDLDLDLDLDLRDFRRPSGGHAEGGDGHGCPSSAEAPGTGPAARTPGSMPVAREPRSAAQGPDDGSAAFFGYFLSRLTKSDSP